MIRYSLKCANDHEFDSWFASAGAFEKLRAAGMVACSVCGTSDVEKALMAPAVQKERPLAAPRSATEEALVRIGKAVDSTSDAIGIADQSEREQRLLEWEKAPNARYCHPREEHLLPVHICQALANKPGKVVFDDYILGLRSVGFLW